LLAAVFNSIAMRVMAVLFGALAASVVFAVMMMQTPLGSRLFNRAISDNSSRIAELVWLIERSPAASEPYVLSAYQSGSRVARIEPYFGEELARDEEKALLIRGSPSPVSDNLADREMRFRTLSLWEMRPALAGQRGIPFSAVSLQQVAIELNDGRVLNLWFAPTISIAQRSMAGLVLLAIILGMGVTMGVAVFWVISRPIKSLEKDAELVGLADTAVPVSETGPRELQRLSAALNRMRRRLAGLIREREEIVVAVAHDIRTGLTRLKLRMEDRLGDEAEIFEGDLVLMEKLVSDMLAYARAENPLVDAELIELGGFVRAFADSSPLEIAVIDDAGQAPFTIAGSRLGLHRLIENLVENARRYGAGQIGIRLAAEQRGYCICVEDNGPGMAEAEIERAFTPFYRGEGSRNRATGGSGLGLGIARAIASTHGARLTLHNRACGGLAARIFFPSELAT
jgi:signal transduction histidine kinase